MRIRYRILTGKMDMKEFHNVADDIAASSRMAGARRRDGQALGLALAAFETPREVLESDGEGEIEQVRGLIASGSMAPHDLVDPGDGWREARDFEPLAEACEAAELRARKKWRQNLVIILAGLAVGAVGLYFLAR